MSFSQFKNIAEVQKAYRIKYEEGVFVFDMDIAVPQKPWLKTLSLIRKILIFFHLKPPEAS